MYKLTIVIPIYNVEAYLRECLDSVLRQDSEQIEVIMVNDCSEDQSHRIASEYKTKFTNSVLIEHTTNQGLGPARNTAMSVAQGEYLMMLDSDDWLCDSAIETILEAIKNANFDIAQFGCNKVSADKIERNLYCVANDDSLTLDEKKSILLSLPNYAWLKVIRREFISSNQLSFQAIFYEDIPWSIETTMQAEAIEFYPVAICNYRQREGSIINTQSARHLDLLNAYDQAFVDIKNLRVKAVLQRNLNNAFIQASYYLYRQRHVRLGGDYLNQFSEIYFKMLRNHFIYPSTARAAAMLAITLAKLFSRKLFR